MQGTCIQGLLASLGPFGSGDEPVQCDEPVEENPGCAGRWNTRQTKDKSVTEPAHTGTLPPDDEIHLLITNKDSSAHMSTDRRPLMPGAKETYRRKARSVTRYGLPYQQENTII